MNHTPVSELNNLKSKLRKLTNLFIPSTCCICNAIALPNHTLQLCSQCATELGRQQIRYKQTNLQGTWRHCYPCFLYQGVVRALIHHIKYRPSRRVCAQLGMALALHLKTKVNDGPWDLVVPVPPLPRHFIRRGFEPTTVLATQLVAHAPDLFTTASPLAKLLGYRWWSWTSAANSRPEKRTLIPAKRIYRRRRHIRRVLKGKRILLIDDVATTGSTIIHAAKLLTDEGAIVDVTLAAIAPKATANLGEGAQRYGGGSISQKPAWIHVNTSRKLA